MQSQNQELGLNSLVDNMDQANIQSNHDLSQLVNLMQNEQNSAGSADHLIEEDIHQQLNSLQPDQRSGAGTKRHASQVDNDLFSGSKHQSAGRFTKQKK